MQLDIFATGGNKTPNSKILKGKTLASKKPKAKIENGDKDEFRKFEKRLLKNGYTKKKFRKNGYVVVRYKNANK